MHSFIQDIRFAIRVLVKSLLGRRVLSVRQRARQAFEGALQGHRWTGLQAKRRMSKIIESDANTLTADPGTGLYSREIAAGYEPRVIASATVILAGAGALAQFIALCLALIGFPNVIIVDMGHFDDVSNITRSGRQRFGMPDTAFIEGHKFDLE